MEEIKDKTNKNTILFLLNNTWTGTDTLSFPAPNSVNITKKSFSKFNNFKYKMYINDPEKNTRAILFLFRDSKYNNRCVIIDKDLNIFNITINVLDNYYNYTIFDILIDYTLNVVSIIDTYITCGNKVNKWSHSDRLSEAEIFLSNIYEIDPNISIKLKDFYENKKQFLNVHFDENINDLYIIPENFPLLTGTNFSSFRWRSPKKLFLYFKTVEDKDFINLYCTQYKKDKLFASITTQTEKSSKLIEDIKGLEGYKDFSIIEYNINFENLILEPIKIIDYKNIPSSIRSIENIILYKNENIKIENIIECIL